MPDRDSCGLSQPDSANATRCIEKTGTDKVVAETQQITTAAKWVADGNQGVLAIDEKRRQVVGNVITEGNGNKGGRKAIEQGAHTDARATNGACQSRP